MIFRGDNIRKNNQDKADELENFIINLLNSCGGDCKNCALENICDDLDVISFHINNHKIDSKNTL